MLDFMRRNANSWVMIFLFGIIIFVFAINFGPWAGKPSDGLPYAAMVNNQTISMAEFRTAYASQFARIKQFRPDYEQAQADKDGLKQIVLEQLISRELLSQMGRDHHLRIAARTLAEEIKERVFGPDTAFSKEEYTRRVNGFFQSTIAQFEEQVEKELVAEQMANLLGTAVFISDNEAKQDYLDKNTKIAIEFIKVNPDNFKINRAIGPAELASFLEKNREQVAKYYNENLSQFVKEPQVQASHILIKTSQTDDAATKAQQKAKAMEIEKRAKGGEDFAKLARSESEDLGTKSNGGELGFFSQGMMVDEFAKAAFALNTNEISTVVESPFGFHIIKLTDKMEARTTNLEQASNEIAEILIKQGEQKSQANAQANLALDQLKSGVALEKISLPGLVNKKLNPNAELTDPNLPIADETPSFSRTASYIQKIGKADEVGEAAFKLSLPNSTPKTIIESDGQFFAIRLKAREDADMSKYESEKDSIKSALVFPRRRAFMQQYLGQLKAQAKISYNEALKSSGEINL